MRAMIPWWLGGTKGKKEDLDPTATRHTGAIIEEQMKWPEMPALPEIDLNLPKWMTEKDYFKFDWPDITIQDLTEGVKNMIKSVLPDPVDDPWLYKLVPQKVYDWLGVSTQVREAQAKMANAQIEVQKLEQDRNDLAKKVAASKLWVETGGEQGQDFSTNIIGSKVGEEEEWQRDQANKIEKLNTKLLAATNKLEAANTELSQVVHRSTPHIVTDLGLLVKQLGFLPISTVSSELAKAAQWDERVLAGHKFRWERSQLAAQEFIDNFDKDDQPQAKTELIGGTEPAFRRVAAEHRKWIANQKNQTGAILAAAAAGSSGGRGSTTINNITVAPSSSNTVSSVNKSENTYGTVDPYTAASGAYG